MQNLTIILTVLLAFNLLYLIYLLISLAREIRLKKDLKERQNKLFYKD